MTVHDSRDTVEISAIPRPRSAEPEDVPTMVALPEAVEVEAAAETPPALPVGEFPWPEPWHYSRGARPRTDFWDVATASWHSRGPYPHTDPIRPPEFRGPDRAVWAQAPRRPRRRVRASSSRASPSASLRRSRT
jgi:hypothetical protein